MQEVNRDALVQAVAVELALAGAGEAGVDEHDQVLAGDLVPARLFKVLFFKVLFFEVLFFKVLFFEVLFGVHARQIGEEGRTQTRANTDKKGEHKVRPYGCHRRRGAICCVLLSRCLPPTKGAARGMAARLHTQRHKRFRKPHQSPTGSSATSIPEAPTRAGIIRG